MVSMDFFSKFGMAKTKSELDEWFEQLREHGRELGVEIEPLTVCERLCLEHEARWMARSSQYPHRDATPISGERVIRPIWS